jgi:long-chain acyl-CoA synthetase
VQHSPSTSQGQLVDALVQICTRHAQRTALCGDGPLLTYCGLLGEASTLAKQLREAGVAEHNAVMVKCSNHPSDFVAFLAVWMAGAAVVPVPRTSPAEVVAAIQTKAQCISCLDLLAGSRPARFAKLSPKEAQQEARRRLLDDAALVIFTSGSTGLPKGAVLSHSAFHGKLLQNCRLFQPTTETVSLLTLNNTFSFGIWVALMTLLRGGRVVVRSRFAPAAFLDTLVWERITFVGVVPTMVRAMFGSLRPEQLEAARLRIAEVGALRQMVIGGEPLGKQLSARLRAFIEPALLYDVYGLTETSTSDFYLDPQDYPARASSIGKPACGVCFRVIGDQGQHCPAGVTGELQLKTHYIMSGYLGDEALSSNAFSDGWFRTGDLATFDQDGFVTIVGRLKDLIVRGGNKITPIEVERALMKCAGVADAMVVGMPDPILGQRIHALLIPRLVDAIDIARIRRELADLLEKYKCPDFFYVGASLPTGRTGKIDRGQLQGWLAAGTLRRIED